MLNENKGEDMIKILQHLQRYVPAKVIESEGPTHVLQHRLLFGGDQITVARTRGAQTAMCSELNEADRLEGFIPVIQDWHAKVVLLRVSKLSKNTVYPCIFPQVVRKYYYKASSAAEHGTLYQLRNKINRTDVVKDPKSNYNACDDFVETITIGHILCAAMKVLEISNFSDQPSETVMGIPSSENLWMYTDAERKAILDSISKTIVKKFVDFSFNGNQDSTDDEVHNYTCRLLSIGCFYLSYKDAIKEGDGKRVLDCWRYLLPIFHNSGRTNYSIEALRLLCHIYMTCLLSKLNSCYLADL